MIYDAIQQMTQMLRNLSTFISEGAALSKDKGFEVGNLLQARLAPDMFNLIRQIQSASDTAKFAAARLSGKEAPKYEDNEATLEEIEARIAKTIAYLEGFGASDFDGAAERRVIMPFNPTGYLDGKDYFVQFAQPNFYFHTTTAYNILRHNGATLGKRVYIGRMDFKPLEEA